MSNPRTLSDAGKIVIVGEFGIKPLDPELSEDGRLLLHGAMAIARQREAARARAPFIKAALIGLNVAFWLGLLLWATGQIDWRVG